MVALLILQFAMPKPLEAALFSLSPSVRQEGGCLDPSDYNKCGIAGLLL